ncbi:MAG: hypothetical protein AB8G05_15415 [Oligoflexales bacterium]
MNGKPPGKNAISVPPSSSDDGICEGDIDALDEFCSQVEFEDISFEIWKNTHSNLNLIISIPLHLNHLQKGGKHTINFVRTISSTCGKYKKKEKIHRQITWSKTVEKLLELTFENEGDQAGDQKGDLIVHLVGAD